jgi:hypothetical protein
MTDLKDAKRGTGSVFPEAVFDASPFGRVEPLLTPDRFKAEFLWGIPLVSPITKDKITDKLLENFLKRAGNGVEIEGKFLIQPAIVRRRLMFHPTDYHANMYLEVPDRPISKVKKLAIVSASYKGTESENDQYPGGGGIYIIPSEWIEMGNATKGLLNVIPLSPGFTSIGTDTAAMQGGAGILHFIGQQGFVPAYWTVEAVVGFCDETGNVPVSINELVGLKASILLLTDLIPQYRYASQSLNLDGMGQSTSDNLQGLLQAKLSEQKEQYKELMKQVKGYIGNSIFMSSI